MTFAAFALALPNPIGPPLRRWSGTDVVCLYPTVAEAERDQKQWAEIGVTYAVVPVRVTVEVGESVNQGV